jgi:hypothetical protein
MRTHDRRQIRSLAEQEHSEHRKFPLNQNVRLIKQTAATEGLRLYYHEFCLGATLLQRGDNAGWRG